jgi:hypothetical protein
MTDKFEMSMMGKLKFFLGFEVRQLRGGTFINQANYTQDMLKRFKMDSGVKRAKNPMPTKVTLELDPNGKEVDQKLYRSMIGLLLYLCASRLDIMLSVGMCARYQAASKESHMMAIKRIFRYLIHTPTFGLWYPKGSSFKLVGYPDSDWAGDKVDRKSTSRAYQFLGRSLVSWSSKKQNCMSLSIALKARLPPPEWLKGRCHRCHAEGHWASICRDPLRCNNCLVLGQKNIGCTALTTPRPPPIEACRHQPPPPRQQRACPQAALESPPQCQATIAISNAASNLFDDFDLHVAISAVSELQHEAALQCVTPSPTLAKVETMSSQSVLAEEAS